MNTLLDAGTLPVKVWGDAPDEQTMRQAEHLADLPFAFKWIALMPDAHVGYGMPIGGVLAADGCVVPNAVGLDIGCGVRTWRTKVPVRDFLPVRDRALNDIQRSVPVGFAWHQRPQTERTALFDDVPDIPPLRAELERATKQVGTLGGGNHFMEAQADPDGTVWMMVHSGSRNLGKQMATHYNDLAKAECARHQLTDAPSSGLAYVDANSALGSEYLAVMDFCLRFAKESRRLMAESMQAALGRHFPGVAPDVGFDIHHNYASFEHHYGRGVWIHRKGAVHAVGEVAIPGSMGTRSWLGRGLCEPESFCSCSHGAGRRLGRGEAKRQLSVEHVVREMRERDVRLLKAKKGDVAEEAPEAYKDIDAVMAAQRDLVEPIMPLTPLGVVKG